MNIWTSNIITNFENLSRYEIPKYKTLSYIMSEWIEIPNVSLSSSNNGARQVAAVNSICSETEQRGSPRATTRPKLHSRHVSRNEFHRRVKNHAVEWNWTLSQSCVKNRVSTRVAIAFVCGMQHRSLPWI